MVLEKTLESPLDCKEIQPVHPKGNQSWIFIGRTEAEAEAPILWPPNAKNWLTGKEPDAGKDWRQEEKGVTDDKMVGWHHCLNGLEFEQASGDGEGQESLAYCSSWGHRVRHDWVTEEQQVQVSSCPSRAQIQASVVHLRLPRLALPAPTLSKCQSENWVEMFLITTCPGSPWQSLAALTPVKWNYICKLIF